MHMLALCLRVDHFATDYKTLAADLGMALSTYVFKRTHTT